VFNIIITEVRAFFKILYLIICYGWTTEIIRVSWLKTKTFGLDNFITKLLKGMTKHMLGVAYCGLCVSITGDTISCF